ncbi:hypothetical protein [Anthocerotibacter panamensis]|uniref:hypothetical protein n=1 Tax=Anthocerotibacter panamensis TaxID=2857077 RepID=UPI001C406C42|nr:hypothetical protein [Anthocerotibacter panamensis]
MILATTNLQGLSSDASNLGVILFFAVLLGILVAFIFAIGVRFLGNQNRILTLVESLIVGVIATISISALATYVQGQGVVAQNIVSSTFGSFAAIAPNNSVGFTAATLYRWEEEESAASNH